MRSVVVAVVLVVSACSSSNPKAPPPVVVRNAVPAEPDPHASRDGLVKRAFVALAAGDVKTLAELVDVKNVMTRAMRCDETGDEEQRRNFDPDREAQRVERRMTEAAASAKGLSIQVLAITLEKQGERMEKGKRLGNCEFLADVAQERVKVKLRLTRADGYSVETDVKVRALTLEGRWYLHRVPNDLAASASSGENTAEVMQGHTDRMCACKDKACSEKVEAEYRAWVGEMAKTAPAKRRDAIDPDEAKRFAEAAKLYAECLMKAAASP
jgi:hypothetical protein